MAEQWFEPEELTEMSRPTMDRAIEAIETGDLEAAKGLCGEMNFPLYCTHCSFMNESMPIQWSGYPVYPSDPPEDYSTDPCTWYWYKDREDIPERHWKRYGAAKPS